MTLTSGISVEVAEDAGDVGVLEEWDRLAVASSQPYAAPGWVLPWWRNDPARGRLRLVTVRDAGRLIAVAPLSVTVGRHGVRTCRLLAGGSTSHASPALSAADAPAAVAALARALAGDDGAGDVIAVEGVPEDAVWLPDLSRCWPGRAPHRCVVNAMPAPYVDLTDGYGGWWQSRSKHFRQQMRHYERAFRADAGDIRQVRDVDELPETIERFVTLHNGRWADRGGSAAVGPHTARTLSDVATALFPDRMQIWVAEAHHRIVAITVFVAAGTQTHFWLQGFDDAFGRFSPVSLVVMHAMQHAAANGCTTVSLGAGAQAFKNRLATGTEQLLWLDLVPHGRRYGYVRAVQLPYRAYRLASTRTPAPAKQRLRALASPRLHRRAGTVTAARTAG